MVENLQTETLILIVYAIIEIIGVCGNLYVIFWSICSSQKDIGQQIIKWLKSRHSPPSNLTPSTANICIQCNGG